jgi:small subunit ribosomal protein S17
MTETETGAAPAHGKPVRNDRKVRQGVVVSDRGDKTIVVRVDRRIRHPLYHKAMVRSKKYHVHDEQNEHRVGDVVRIQETRPISRLKRWRVIELVERPDQA